jgi:hypothetical protein
LERKRKLKLPDRGEVEAVELGFRSSGEFWNEYLIDDGTVIRLKVVVSEVFRVEGEYDADGNPAYIVKSQNILATSAPEDLRRSE